MAGSAMGCIGRVKDSQVVKKMGKNIGHRCVGYGGHVRGLVAHGVSQGEND